MLTCDQIAFILAAIYQMFNDRMAAYFTRRNGGIREAEHRLPWMLPALILAPVGLVRLPTCTSTQSF